MKSKSVVKNCLVVLLFGITISAVTFGQTQRQVKDYEWKMMSMATGTYDWTDGYYGNGNRDFWQKYSTNKTYVYENLMRGKKLGFNAVRIPINYVDQGSQPYYDHAWPLVMGSGTPSTSSNYVANINDLLNFCSSKNIKVCLLLFCYGGSNDVINVLYKRDSLPTSRYATGIVNGYPSVPDSSLNKWFIDAMAWTNYILSNIDSTKVGAYELYNEATPLSSEFYQNSPYPYECKDIFYLEMSNYFHAHWPSRKLMISLSGAQDAYWTNLKYMLTNTYTRPSYLSALNNYLGSQTNYAGKYFDIFSIHDYHDYSSNIYFTTVLSLEPYQSHAYQWFIGECGFEISSVSPDQFETDQAKYFQYFFQEVRDLDNSLIQKGDSPLKGMGIWSVMDYNMTSGTTEVDDHWGIMSSEQPWASIRKRKAASVLRNAFMGYVANPDFELGMDQYAPNGYMDTLFNDNQPCNGWTAWYGIGQTYNAGDYSYLTSGSRGYVLQLNPAPTRKIGWSDIPGTIYGGLIRVKPNTNVTVGVDAMVSNNQTQGIGKLPTTLTTNVFATLAWIDAYGNWISTPIPGAYSFTPGQWKTISQTLTVPANAYYAAPYLMAYNNSYTVQFDNVTYTPDWRPLISFNFDDDITYFNAKPGVTAPGWLTSQGISTNQYDPSGFSYLNLYRPYTVVKSTHYIQNGLYTTALRMRSGNEYSAAAYINSQAANFKFLNLQDASSEYPSQNFDAGTLQIIQVAGSSWGIYSTDSIQYRSGYHWLQVQFEDQGYANTKIKEVALFEHTIGGPGSQTQQPLLPKKISINNYPNPFNPNTRIEYQVPVAARVTVKIYDIIGREVRTLVDEEKGPGLYTVVFDGSSLASGIYICRISDATEVKAIKLLLLK